MWQRHALRHPKKHNETLGERNQDEHSIQKHLNLVDMLPWFYMSECNLIYRINLRRTVYGT